MGIGLMGPGCMAGFALPGDEDDDADTDTPTDPTSKEPGVPHPAECVDSSDCGECSYCANGVCEDDVGNCECAHLFEPLGFRCTWYECWTDEECPEGEFCNGYECEPHPIPPEPDACSPVELSTTVWAVPPGTSQVAVADLDDDGILEIGHATPNGALGLVDGATGETLGATQLPDGTVEVASLRAEGPDALMAIINATVEGTPQHRVVSVRWEEGAPQTVVSAAQDGHALASTIDDLDGDGGQELLISQLSRLEIWSYDGSGPQLQEVLENEDQPFGTPIVTTGPDATTRYILSVVGSQTIFTDPGGTVLERGFVGGELQDTVRVMAAGGVVDGYGATVLAGSLSGPSTEFFLGWSDAAVSAGSASYAVPGYPRGAGFADLLGDDDLEAVLATDDSLAIVALDGHTVDCWLPLEADGSSDLAFGDVDADGRTDAIALGFLGTVTIVHHGSD